MKQMSLGDIGTTAGWLSSQVAGGIPLPEIAREMQSLQWKYKQFWQAAEVSMSTGNNLSSTLTEIWPESLVSIVRAGEDSGELEDILIEIESTVELQLSLRSKIMSFAYPIGCMVAGFGVFLFFMAMVIPAIVEGQEKKTNSDLVRLSTFIHDAFKNHWLSIAVVSGLVVAACVQWVRSPDNRAAVMDTALRTPILGKALASLQYAVWMKFLKLIVKSGQITLRDSLKMSLPQLPPSLRPAIELIIEDMIRIGTGRAADPELHPDDERASLPRMVTNAFKVADMTGNIEPELVRSSAALFKFGTMQFNAVMNVLKLFALIIASIFIMSPLLAYFLQMADAVGEAMHMR